MVIRDSIYVEKWRVRAHTDTITVTQRDSIPYPVEVPAPRSPLALSERVRVLGKGCLLAGGIGALLILYVILRLYFHR